MTRTWADLEDEKRELFRGKLTGLYGRSDDESAYNFLPQDKQEALDLLAERLGAHGLWEKVGRIVNVYGEPGVGMYFSAAPDFEATLRRRRDFTSWFARHRPNLGGFFEKRRRRAALHFLFIDRQGEREWHVHLDFYGPMGSIWSIIQHLYYETFGTFSADWRAIKRVVSEVQDRRD